MAVTSIWRVKGWLGKVVVYVENPDKTTNPAYYEKEDMKVISKWKYAKLGITKQGVTLFSSSCDMNNYTVFPQEFQEQYLYTYILSLYMKIYIIVS